MKHFAMYVFEMKIPESISLVFYLNSKGGTQLWLFKKGSFKSSVQYIHLIDELHLKFLKDVII